MLGIMGSGFRLSNHSGVGQGRILLIGPWDPWWGKFKWGELRDIQGFSSLSYWFLMGETGETFGLPFIWTSDFPLIPLSCLCLCIHVFLVFYPANTMQIYSIPSVLPFWPLPSTCLNNFLGDLLKIAVYIFMCCEQELQATGFRIDQQMRDAKLLGLTQVGESGPRVFRFRIFWWEIFSLRKNPSPFFWNIPKNKIDDRYIYIYI